MKERNELVQVIRDYFAEARKQRPEITDDMLDDEGDGEKIYYMNGNDGTDFDWGCNHHLCEFMMFYKESGYGFIKVFVYKDGSICGYLYDDRGFAKATELPETHIAEEEAKHFAALMFQAADRAEKYDKTISQLDFDCEFEPGVLRLMEVYGGEE